MTDGMEPRGRTPAGDAGGEALRPDLEPILQRALDLGEDGQWEAMADHLEEALEEDPENPYVLCWLGVALREMGLDTMAYERFRKCLEQQPDDPHVLATAGNAVAAFDDPDAEAALRTAAMTAPELPLARWMYGAYLSREGMLEKALEELYAAAEMDPENPAVVFELGVALALDEKESEAVDVFDRAARLDPDDGWVRVLLGLALLREERVDEAARELGEGARRRPGDVEAQLLAGLASAASGRLDLGYEMVERARQRAEGLDEALVAEVQDRIEAGPGPSRRFLAETLAPGAYRERLMTRP